MNPLTSGLVIGLAALLIAWNIEQAAKEYDRRFRKRLGRSAIRAVTDLRVPHRMEVVNNDLSSSFDIHEQMHTLLGDVIAHEINLTRNTHSAFRQHRQAAKVAEVI